MGASYPLADLMAALETKCYWWQGRHVSEHDDMHRFSLDPVSLLPYGHFAFVKARSSALTAPSLYGRVTKARSIPSILRVENRTEKIARK